MDSSERSRTIGGRIGFRLLTLAVAVALMMASQATAALELENHPAIHELIDEMVSKHQFEKIDLEHLFRHVAIRDSVVRAMKRPAERLPWHKYRSLFISDQGIQNGVAFWARHRATLEQASEQYGVPAQIIVAIIGVETRYGKVLGKHRVLDSLTTLVLRYPRRATFFRRELVEFLLLSREEGFDPLALMGSYAGAMGVPQFMPSSYRAYAVDFSGDARRDLLSEPADAIGSVANYLARHRWQPGKPVVANASVAAGVDVDALVAKRLKPESTVAALTQAGINIDGSPAAETAAALMSFETPDGLDYRIGYENFFVVTRYNSSRLYALAVYELSEAILARRASSQ